MIKYALICSSIKQSTFQDAGLNEEEGAEFLFS